MGSYGRAGSKHFLSRAFHWKSLPLACMHERIRTFIVDEKNNIFQIEFQAIVREKKVFWLSAVGSSKFCTKSDFFSLTNSNGNEMVGETKLIPPFVIMTYFTSY